MFIDEIKEAVKKPLLLRINNNHSTMLSVKWDPFLTKVSMHKIFLEAPKEVQEAVKNHITTVNSTAGSLIRSFIHQKMRERGEKEVSSKKRTTTQGMVYDLRELFEKVNKEYFSSSLDLPITWFGRSQMPRGRKITFGLYQAPLKLLKIHRMMDNILFPSFVVEFVIYHEMLHHVIPSHFDENGRHRMHCKEFKRREKLFRQYSEASAWLKEFVKKMHK